MISDGGVGGGEAGGGGVAGTNTDLITLAASADLLEVMVMYLDFFSIDSIFRILKLCQHQEGIWNKLCKVPWQK